jgi:hypothetical protein
LVRIGVRSKNVAIDSFLVTTWNPIIAQKTKSMQQKAVQQASITNYEAPLALHQVTHPTCTFGNHPDSSTFWFLDF